MHDKIIEIAPSEGNQPLEIFKDRYVKEINFPTPFFGDPRDEDIRKEFKYKKNAQWEVFIQVVIFQAILLIYFSK